MSPDAMPFNHPISVLKAEFFLVLGHPARVRILELLREGERPVGQYQDELGLDSSGTSQHLGALRKQGHPTRRVVPVAGAVLLAWSALVLAHPSWLPHALAGVS